MLPNSERITLCPLVRSYKMNIVDAKYGNAEKSCVIATINGVKVSVPTDPSNSDYEEMLKQVNDGTITIAAAD